MLVDGVDRRIGVAVAADGDQAEDIAARGEAEHADAARVDAVPARRRPDHP